MTQFKKSALLIFGLSVSAFAGGSHFNLGLSGNKFDTGSNQLGGSFGLDMIKTLSNGIEIGASIDADGFLVKRYQSLNDDAGELVDGLFRAGYNFNPMFEIPVAVRGGIGYGVGRVGSTTMDGMVYDVEGEYDIGSKYVLGVKYKKANLTMTMPNNPKADYSQIGGYFGFRF